MADKLTSDSYGPNIGISAIELAEGLENAPKLPEESQVVPIDSSVEARLASILEAKNFDRVMLEALKPGVQDKSILKPGAFHGLRREVVEKLNEAIAESPDSEARRELESLRQLLDKLAADHDLGEHYRYALLKG